MSQDFSSPDARMDFVNKSIYEQVALKLSEVNNMAAEKVITTLQFYHLSTKGNSHVLRKRLCVHLRKYLSVYQTLNEPPRVLTRAGNQTSKFYSNFLVLDFEATCHQRGYDDYQHEIIEVPIILYNVKRNEIVDTFHSFCQPSINPILTDFCKDLTGIQQETVDSAKPFKEVFNLLVQWLNSHNVFQKPMALVCDCNADMARLMRIQCKAIDMPMPLWCQQWINVRKEFKKFYGLSDSQKITLRDMVEYIGEEFQGRAHSGLDDTKNILQIVRVLLADGCELRINERLNNKPPYFTESVNKWKAESESCIYLSAFNLHNLSHFLPNDS